MGIKFGGMAEISMNKKYWRFLIWRVTKLDLGTPPHLHAHTLQLDTSTCNMECELAMDSCIQWHHVFKNIWTLTIGEQLPCKREVGNAVAVL